MCFHIDQNQTPKSSKVPSEYLNKIDKNINFKVISNLIFSSWNSPPIGNTPIVPVGTFYIRKIVAPKIKTFPSLVPNSIKVLFALVVARQHYKQN